jgi:hypothetical protein
MHDALCEQMMRCTVCQNAPSVVADQMPVNLNLIQDSQQPMIQRVKALWQRHAAKARTKTAVQVAMDRSRAAAGSAMRTYASIEWVNPLKSTGTHRMDLSGHASPVVNDPASRGDPSHSIETQADRHGVCFIISLMAMQSSGQGCAV